MAKNTTIYYLPEDEYKLCLCDKLKKLWTFGLCKSTSSKLKKNSAHLFPNIKLFLAALAIISAIIIIIFFAKNRESHGMNQELQIHRRPSISPFLQYNRYNKQFKALLTTKTTTTRMPLKSSQPMDNETTKLKKALSSSRDNNDKNKSPQQPIYSTKTTERTTPTQTLLKDGPTQPLLLRDGASFKSFSPSKCNRAKCLINALAETIIITEGEWLHFPKETSQKMRAEQKSFNQKANHESFKKQPKLPYLNKENIDTIFEYHGMFAQITGSLKVALNDIDISTSSSMDKKEIHQFWTHMKQIQRKMQHTTNKLTKDCNEMIKETPTQYLQGYEELKLKGYTPEESLIILFDQINFIFFHMKIDFYKRQICLGNIKCE